MSSTGTPSNGVRYAKTYLIVLFSALAVMWSLILTDNDHYFPPEPDRLVIQLQYYACHQADEITK